MDIQRVLKRRCQVGKKFRQSMSQGLSNEQCTPDHRNVEKQGQDNVPGPGTLFQENSPPDMFMLHREALRDKDRRLRYSAEKIRLTAASAFAGEQTRGNSKNCCCPYTIAQYYLSGYYSPCGTQRSQKLVLPNELTVINFLLNVVPLFWGIFKHFHTAGFSPHIAFYQV